MSPGQTILIAEPIEALSAQLSPFLQQKGIDVIHAKTLKQILLRLQDERIDVLVLDAELVDEECELISIIKSIEARVPIILCAGENTPEFETKARQQRIFFYHIKSFGTEDLEMAISNAVQKEFHY